MGLRGVLSLRLGGLFGLCGGLHFWRSFGLWLGWRWRRLLLGRWRAENSGDCGNGLKGDIRGGSGLDWIGRWR